MMKKIIVLLSLALAATGCSITINEAPEVAEVEDVAVEVVEVEATVEPVSADDALSALLESHPLYLDQTKSTIIEVDRETPQKLNVTIKEDGYPDDSLKGMTYTMVLEKKADGSWEVTSNEESGMECYRGMSDGGLCL